MGRFKRNQKKHHAQEQAVEEVVVEETQEEAKAEQVSVKDEVAQKIHKQMQKKREKEEGRSRILEYLSTEHKWENYLFVVVSLVTLVLGILILTGALVVKEDFPLIGSYPKVFAWILVVFAGFGLLYAIYPFFKPAFPEFKKINWLSWRKFLGNVIRVFTFLIIFTLLFLLYDVFISQLLGRFF